MKEFKYFGSIVHSSLTSDVLCNFALEGALQGMVYSALVLTVLLYGSEV